MNYFILNFETDYRVIDSFLESASLAHHQPKKTIEWFYWKYHDNPFGQSVMACAEYHGIITGCVAYGIQPFWLNGRLVKAALSFETFVHPLHQKKGIFSKLLKYGEEELNKREIAFILNFPNANSLRGFLNSKLIQLPNPEYWIRPSSLKPIPKLLNLRKTFEPTPSNFHLLNAPSNLTQSVLDRSCSLITLEYLRWRFFTFPVSEYVTIENEDFYSVLRMGMRGSIREAQVLFVNINSVNKFSTNNFVNKCKEKTEFDVISFPISIRNPLRKKIANSFFVKVPNHTNACYKVLDKNKVTENEIMNISFRAINYHTY